MRIGMLGTRGVPARYGGFETCVEEVGRRMADQGHDVLVYCREVNHAPAHLGMTRIELPALRRKSLETLSHTALSSLHAVLKSKPDIVIVFNAGNSPLLPLFKLAGIPVVIHMDGLEWKRAKWRGLGQVYYRYAEAWGIYLASAVISDAQAIADIYHEAYGISSSVISYGAPVVSRKPEALRSLALTSERFTLIVARWEPENHVVEALKGALLSSSQDPIALVGSVPYPTAYSREIERLAGVDARVQMLGPVWDQDILNALYAHCRLYIHGHSVGGTNPSLLRAMGAGAATAAFDVVFNRETLNEHGLFWSTPEELRDLIDDTPAPVIANLGSTALHRAASVYQWEDVTENYLVLLKAMRNTGSRGTGASLWTCLKAARGRRPSRLADVAGVDACA